MNEASIDGAFGLLVSDALRRCDRTQQRLTDLEPRFRSRLEDRSYRMFANFLAMLNERLAAWIVGQREIFTRTSNAGLRRSIYKLVRAATENMAIHIEAPVQLLSVDRHEHLKLFEVPMTRLTKAVVPGAEVVFLPWNQGAQYELQYLAESTAAEAFTGIEDSLDRLFRGSEILKLRYPSVRDADLFQHAIFAHEIAHAAIARPLPERLARSAERSAAGPATFESAAAHGAPTTPNEDASLIGSWFTELACDILAMRMIGPAFVVAYAEVTQVHRQAVQSSDGRRQHPGPKMRFRVLQEELARFDTAGLTPGMREALSGYAGSHAGTFATAEPSPQASTWLDEAIARYRQSFLPALLTPDQAEFTPERLARDLPLVLSGVRRGAYPAERLSSGRGSAWSTPIDWRSILNGVLLAHIEQTGPPAVASDHAVTRREAANLAAGGIELSELHRRALALKAQFTELHPEAGR